MDSRLSWIQRNRTRRTNVRAASDAVSSLAKLLTQPGGVQASRKAARLVGVVDEEFRKYCRIEVDAQGTAVVNVKHADLVFPMRTKWQGLLEMQFDRARRARVTFRYGDGGAEVPLDRRSSSSVE